jgi:hypothetical protein
MRSFSIATIALLAITACGCGAVYQAGTQVRAHHMLNTLEVGQTATELHQKWGQPDIITDAADGSQTWSYAERPNSDDVAASLFYTSAKEGDAGTFVDLQMADGKLKSWTEAQHRIPNKKGTAFGYSIGAGNGSVHF